MFLIVDYVVSLVVVVAILAFIADVLAVEFDVVISAVVFHLVVVLVLFVVAAVASDCENDDGDSAVVWHFLELFADYFGGLDDVCICCF